MPDEYLKRDTRGSTLKFVTPAVHAQLFFLVVTDGTRGLPKLRVRLAGWTRRPSLTKAPRWRFWLGLVARRIGPPRADVMLTIAH